MVTMKGDVDAGLARISANLTKALRPAAQAGAQVFYEAVLAKVPVSGKAHLFYGRAAAAAPRGEKKEHAYLFEPGALRRAIYQKHIPERSGENQQVYVISWRKKGPNAVPYAHWVEFGTSKMPAHPFLRPAYDTARQDALKAANARLAEALRA